MILEMIFYFYEGCYNSILRQTDGCTNMQNYLFERKSVHKDESALV